MSDVTQSLQVNPKDKIFTASFLLLSGAFFTGFLAMAALMFLIPLYLQNIGGDEAASGIAMGIFTLSAIFFRLVMGSLMDRHGPKIFLLFGVGIFALTTFFYGQTESLFWIYLLRALQGTGWGAIFAASYTMLGQLVPASRRNEALGYFSTIPPIGLAIGPAAGDLILQAGGFNTTFLVAGSIASAACVFIIILRQPPQVPQDSSGSIFSRSALFYSVIVFLMNVVVGPVVTFLPLLGEARDLPNTGIFFSIYGLVVICTRPLGGKMAMRFGSRKIIIPSFISLALATFLLAFTHSFFLLVLAALALGAGLSLAFPVIMTLCIEACPEQERGRAMATFTSAIDFGFGLGSICLGFVLVYTGYTFIFLFCTAVTVCNLAMILKHKPLAGEKS